MMWYLTVTTEYVEAGLRQSTKYQRFQIPVNWAIFLQPFPLPPTHSGHAAAI